MFFNTNNLQAEFELRYTEEKRNFDALGNSNASSAGGSSTGPGTSAGTPAAAMGGTPHIRLKVRGHNDRGGGGGRGGSRDARSPDDDTAGSGDESD